MMPRRRRVHLHRGLLLFLLLVLFFLQAQPVGAHPLGNFSVNRYSRLQVEATQIHLVYVIDMAEIPTYQERPKIDHDDDGTFSETEQQRYLMQQVATLQEGLELVIDGRRLALDPQSQQLTFSPGAGDLPTMRLEVTFLAPLQADAGSLQGFYTDHNYSNRVGWQEVVVRATEPAVLLESNVPTEDISEALRRYPDDLLQAPLSVNSATFRFESAASVSNASRAANIVPLPATTTGERFGGEAVANLVAMPQLGIGVLLAAALAAFTLGAAHALTPGHGKTIVGAYLVGSRGTPWHALFLGVTTTVTHTFGIFVFGLIVLFASHFILPEQLYPWLGVISGLLVITIGASLLWNRWQTRHAQNDHQAESGYHYHLGIGHKHEPPLTQSTSWKSLLALGISGGLLPCPSALVLLLSAIALQRVALGLILVVIFSLGLASVLTGIGLALVYARRLFQRFPTGNSRLLATLPLISALFITIAGAVITLKALVQTGIL